MKKKNLIKGGAAGLLTLLLTAAMGCFASFAYDSASLKTCTVENRNTVVITGTAEKDVPQETVPETLEDGTVVPPETEVPDDGYYYLFELQLWDRDVRRFVFSDRIPDYAPIEDYLTRLPVWDGKDRIRPLAARIPCDNVRWEQLFYTWFLSMVAHWQGRDKQHGNSLSPLLVGGQGCGKSTFCFNLLPPDLNKYYTDSIDFSKKRDAELYLTRFGLINIDEFDQVSARHQGFLKHLLQKPVVNVRKPHATQVESVKRYASFIATSNHTDLLGDPSGSRRFICIEVKGMIDNAQPIDYLQLYAQAVAALNNNERYWLTHEEEVSQMQANEAFQQRPLFEDLFFQYYRPASHKEEGLKISAGEIYLSLQKKSGVKLPMSNVSVFGRFLKKIGLKTQLANSERLHLVVEKQ